jgi:hypothetical protein
MPDEEETGQRTSSIETRRATLTLGSARRRTASQTACSGFQQRGAGCRPDVAAARPGGLPAGRRLEAHAYWILL